MNFLYHPGSSARGGVVPQHHLHPGSSNQVAAVDYSSRQQAPGATFSLTPQQDPHRSLTKQPAAFDSHANTNARALLMEQQASAAARQRQMAAASAAGNVVYHHQQQQLRHNNGALQQDPKRHLLRNPALSQHQYPSGMGLAAAHKPNHSLGAGGMHIPGSLQRSGDFQTGVSHHLTGLNGSIHNGSGLHGGTGNHASYPPMNGLAGMPSTPKTLHNTALHPSASHSLHGPVAASMQGAAGAHLGLGGALQMPPMHHQLQPGQKLVQQQQTTNQHQQYQQYARQTNPSGYQQQAAARAQAMMQQQARRPVPQTLVHPRLATARPALQQQFASGPQQWGRGTGSGYTEQGMAWQGNTGAGYGWARQSPSPAPCAQQRGYETLRGVRPAQAPPAGRPAAAVQRAATQPAASAAVMEAKRRRMCGSSSASSAATTASSSSEPSGGGGEHSSSDRRRSSGSITMDWAATAALLPSLHAEDFDSLGLLDASLGSPDSANRIFSDGAAGDPGQSLSDNLFSLLCSTEDPFAERRSGAGEENGGGVWNSGSSAALDLLAQASAPADEWAFSTRTDSRQGGFGAHQSFPGQDFSGADDSAAAAEDLLHSTVDSLLGGGSRNPSEGQPSTEATDLSPPDQPTAELLGDRASILPASSLGGPGGAKLAEGESAGQVSTGGDAGMKADTAAALVLPILKGEIPPPSPTGQPSTPVAPTASASSLILKGEVGTATASPAAAAEGGAGGLSPTSTVVKEVNALLQQLSGETGPSAGAGEGETAAESPREGAAFPNQGGAETGALADPAMVKRDSAPAAAGANQQTTTAGANSAPLYFAGRDSGAGGFAHDAGRGSDETSRAQQLHHSLSHHHHHLHSLHGHSPPVASMSMMTNSLRRLRNKARPTLNSAMLDELNDLREFQEPKYREHLIPYQEGISFPLGEGGRELLRACLNVRGCKGRQLQGASVPSLLSLAQTWKLWNVALRIKLERATGQLCPIHESFVKFKAIQSAQRKCVRKEFMFTERDNTGKISKILYDENRRITLGKEGREWLRAQLRKLHEKDPVSMNQLLVENGLSYSELRNATVQQLSQMAYVCKLWPQVESACRNQEERKLPRLGAQRDRLNSSSSSVTSSDSASSPASSPHQHHQPTQRPTHHDPSSNGVVSVPQQQPPYAMAPSVEHLLGQMSFNGCGSNRSANSTREGAALGGSGGGQQHNSAAGHPRSAEQAHTTGGEATAQPPQQHHNHHQHPMLQRFSHNAAQQAAAAGAPVARQEQSSNTGQQQHSPHVDGHSNSTAEPATRLLKHEFHPQTQDPGSLGSRTGTEGRSESDARRDGSLRGQTPQETYASGHSGHAHSGDGNASAHSEGRQRQFVGVAHSQAESPGMSDSHLVVGLGDGSHPLKHDAGASGSAHHGHLPATSSGHSPNLDQVGLGPSELGAAAVHQDEDLLQAAAADGSSVLSLDIMRMLLGGGGGDDLLGDGLLPTDPGAGATDMPLVGWAAAADAPLPPG